MQISNQKKQKSMSHAFVISMTRPHEALGLRQPVGRRLPQGLAGWNLALFAVSLLLVGAYIVQVNSAAAKAYQLRDMQSHVDELRTEATILQNQYVAETSLRAISEKASQLGFVPVDSIQYVNPSAGSYAMAR